VQITSDIELSGAGCTTAITPNQLVQSSSENDTKAPQRGAFFVSKRFLKKTFSNTLGRTKFEKKAMTHRTQTANQVVT
jgi:hypothetical protein